jgi:integrase
MPKSLSDTVVRNAKPKIKPYKLSDGDGLFLVVMPNGSKYWRMKYFISAKEKTLALGVYPDVSLADAREKRGQARKVLATGSDPSDSKKAAKRSAILQNANSFEVVSREWLERRIHVLAPSTYRSRLRRLENYILPSLGSKPIASLSAVDVLDMARIVEKKGTLELARRATQMTGQIFMYAIATGRAERNPVPDLRGALKPPVVKHRAYLQENELPDYLQKLETYDGHPQTKLALRLLLLTFVRTTELRAAEWNEIDWGKSEWRIPASRMKMKEIHVVPLAPQSIAVLKELKKISGGLGFVFPNLHNSKTFMSENTMLYALYRMGYHSRATGHGFRSTASTILNENGYRPDVIERQLAHGERNAVRAAYNHAQYLPERREMMQWWADYLDGVVDNK